MTGQLNYSIKTKLRETAAKSSPPSGLKRLKSDLVERLAAEYAELSPRLVYQAVNEAHALASLTHVPHLVLPTLAEEKVQKLAAWSSHQRALLGGEQVAFAA